MVGVGPSASIEPLSSRSHFQDTTRPSQVEPNMATDVVSSLNLRRSETSRAVPSPGRGNFGPLKSLSSKRTASQPTGTRQRTELASSLK